VKLVDTTPIKDEKRYADEGLRCLDENPFLPAFEAKKIGGGQRTKVQKVLLPKAPSPHLNTKYSILNTKY
jgi:hypothetical protein